MIGTAAGYTILSVFVLGIIFVVGIFIRKLYLNLKKVKKIGKKYA